MMLNNEMNRVCGFYSNFVSIPKKKEGIASRTKDEFLNN